MFLGLAPAPQDAPLRTDANGWPQPVPVVQPSRAARSDFAAPPVQAPAPAAPAAPAPGGAAPAPRGRLPLAEVFERVGHPSAMQDCKGVIARMQVRLFDPTGVEQTRYEVFHEADLASRDRDRLQFTQARKTYGRDGATVWARHIGMLWPAWEGEARDELELHGLMLRLPWAFADTERFVAGAREIVQHDGRAIARWKVQARGPESAVVGPVPNAAPVDRFELDCHEDSNEPFELRYVLSATGVPRRVLLRDWRPCGGVKLPMVRTWVDTEGKKALEIEIVRIDSGQALPVGQFAPEARR